MNAPHRLLPLGLTVLVFCLTACTPPPDEQAEGGAASTRADSIHVFAETFITARDTADNIDSPAVWHGPQGEHWLISTAKETDVLVVHDAATGEPVRRVGGPGTGRGQLDRPNGIAVIDDLAIVVERDNARLQVFSLPGFNPMGLFGEGTLERPYGLTAFSVEPGSYRLFVTDNYEDPGEQIPPDSALGRRVHEFRLVIEDSVATGEHVKSFGPTAGDGRLRVVESIYADAANERLMIAEEEEPRSHVKVFTLDGEYTGEQIGQNYYPNQAEGIALYACGTDEGYWITTDQGESSNTFHVFDRVSLEHRGSFAGEITTNTDGIALTPVGFGPFPGGAFYAVHDDAAVSAFAWGQIAQALGLRQDCSGL